MTKCTNGVRAAAAADGCLTMQYRGEYGHLLEPLLGERLPAFRGDRLNRLHAVADRCISTRPWMVGDRQSVRDRHRHGVDVAIMDALPTATILLRISCHMSVISGGFA